MKRRDFITAVAASAGSAYAAMKALDLLESPASAQAKGTFQLQRPSSRKRVVILGAGLAGMASAYELGKVGYDCIILEARSRAGGRCWTLRGGDQFTDINGQTETIRFDQGLYFNPGPARIPQHHVTLEYCREFGVAMEVRTNLNRNQYYYKEDSGPLSNRKVRVREAVTDMRGYISELLAKAVNQDAINAPLTTEDKEKLIEFLRTYGDLDPDLFYKGSTRRGYTLDPGAGLQAGDPADPYDLSALIELGFAGYDAGEWTYDQQMTMLQPVGGIDQIAKAFERRVGERIAFGSEVKEIRKTSKGVRILYTDSSGNKKQAIGDYCICTIPLSVLKSIPSDFSSSMKAAIASVSYAVTGKSGLQFSRRFWEEDEQIYGGITSTNLGITQIWYPSENFLAKKGVMLGYYNFGLPAAEIGNLPPAQRLALAIAQGSKIHPQYNKHFENGLSIFWPTIPYSLGGWATYTTAGREQYYPRLNQPDGNIYLAGEHLSYLTGWMAGALDSARLVTKQINALT